MSLHLWALGAMSGRGEEGGRSRLRPHRWLPGAAACEYWLARWRAGCTCTACIRRWSSDDKPAELLTRRARRRGLTSRSARWAGSWS